MEKQSIRTFIQRFKNKEFDKPDVHTQCEAGWWDWFCKDTSLARKTQVLAKKLLSILPSHLIDVDKQYVFFKNNCPMGGPLYDDFRICDLESGNVIWTVTPKSGHTGAAEVWGKKNEFKGPIIAGSWKDVVKFFKEI